VTEWDVRNLTVQGNAIRYELFYRPLAGNLRPPIPAPARAGPVTPPAARSRPAPRRPIIKTLPKAGGVPTEMPVQPPSNNFQIVGDNFCWIDYKPDEVKQVKENGEDVEVHL